MGAKSEYAKGDPNAKVPIPDEPVTKDDYQVLKKIGAEVFAKNRVKRQGYYFHMPSSGSYPSLFGWDSGWHAIAMTRIDPQIAASEIEYLSMQQMPDGRIPHEVVFKDIGIKENMKTKLGRVISRNQYDKNMISVQMDPPSYIVAAEKIYEQTKDKDWVARVLPRFEKAIYWMTHTRDLFKDGLCTIVHPWESGTDSSPAYDKIIPISYKTPFGEPYRMLLYPAMFDRFKALGYDLNKIAEDNRFIVEDLTVIGILIRAVISVAKLNEALGNADKAKAFYAQAQKMMDSVDQSMWVEEKGCYFIRYDLKKPKLSMRITGASLCPLFTGICRKDRAEKLIHNYVLNKDRFWLPYVFTFTSWEEMKGDKVYGEDLLLWRSHAIWSNFSWMMNEALLNYGYKNEARELTRRAAKMIRHEGYRDFYDDRTGQGRRAFNFGWAGLILDMIHRTWPEAVS